MAITGISYRRVNGYLEPLGMVKGGVQMAAKKKVATSPIGYVTEDGKEVVTGAMVDGKAMTLEELKEKRIEVHTGPMRILSDEDVANVMGYETAPKEEAMTLSELFDNITNPAHYTDGRKYEPRKVIIDWDLNFYLGNVVKYISRAGRKGDAVNDLKKAAQYLQWEIERLEEKGEN